MCQRRFSTITMHRIINKNWVTFEQKQICVVNRNIKDLVFVSKKETIQFNEHYQSYEVDTPSVSQLKVPITFMGILNICNLWILLRKIVIYISCRMKMSSSWIFLLLKLTEITSTQEYVKRFSYTQIPGFDVTLANLTAKKSMKMTFSADKIYYNFSQ